MFEPSDSTLEKGSLNDEITQGHVQQEHTSTSLMCNALPGLIQAVVCPENSATDLKFPLLRICLRLFLLISIDQSHCNLIGCILVMDSFDLPRLARPSRPQKPCAIHGRPYQEVNC